MDHHHNFYTFCICLACQVLVSKTGEGFLLYLLAVILAVLIVVSIVLIICCCCPSQFSLIFFCNKIFI